MKPIFDLGFIQIPTFYLIISASLTFALLLMHEELKNNTQLNRAIAFDLAIIMMLFGFLGARLTHIFYEELTYYTSFPLEAFKFWNGGFVFYGGFIAALIACLIFLKTKKESILKWGDFFAPYVSLSYILGRVGCFFEGCCYGQHCDLPWSVSGRHPTQLYMAFAEAVLMGLLILFRKHRQGIFQYQGYFFFLWLFGHGVNRFIIEYFREDDRGSLIADLSLGQWLSLTLMFVSASLIVHRWIQTKRQYNHSQS